MEHNTPSASRQPFIPEQWIESVGDCLVSALEVHAHRWAAELREAGADKTATEAGVQEYISVRRSQIEERFLLFEKISLDKVFQSPDPSTTTLLTPDLRHLSSSSNPNLTFLDAQERDVEEGMEFLRTQLARIQMKRRAMTKRMENIKRETDRFALLTETAREWEGCPVQRGEDSLIDHPANVAIRQMLVETVEASRLVRKTWTEIK
mmetsp:Transcript_10204/g.20581  ORF Transcript_10204/g.20581 Transcript_10204/m.20581 type:complete len:207 (-) Transcript_10204:21-641(-)